MNTPTTTLILRTYVDVIQTIVELIELPATVSVESYDCGRVVLQFTLARVAAARVWNAAHALMSSMSDAYVAHKRSLGAVFWRAPFCDVAPFFDVAWAGWSRGASFRSLALSADNCDTSIGAPRDPSALAQRDAWCAELRTAMLRFVAEDTRCFEADACFSEFLEEKMRIVGVASRHWLYPTKCAFESSAVYSSMIQ